MSDDKVESFGKALAEKKGDSALWTPLEMLRDTIRRIESGEIAPTKIYVAMQQPSENGVDYPFACAGATRLEYIGVLATHQHKCVWGTEGEN